MLQLLHNHCTVYKWATVEEDWKQVQRYEGFYIHPRNTSSSERKANPSPTTPLVNCPLSLLTCCTHFEQVSRISLSVMGEEKTALLGLVSLLRFEWHARAKFPLFNKYKVDGKRSANTALWLVEWSSSTTAHVLRRVGLLASGRCAVSQIWTLGVRKAMSASLRVAAWFLSVILVLISTPAIKCRMQCSPVGLGSCQPLQDCNYVSDVLVRHCVSHGLDCVHLLQQLYAWGVGENEVGW